MPRRCPLGLRPGLLALVLGATGLAAGARGLFADPPAAPIEDERAEAIETQTKKGLAAYKRGNHEEALTRMERLEKLDAKNPLVRTLRARVYARTGRYEDALALATESAKAAPDDRASSTLRFDLLMRLGRHDEALSAATAVLADRPGDLTARTARGLVLEERGRRKEALEDFDKVVAAYNDADPAPEDLPAVAKAALRATRLSENPADDLTMAALNLLKPRIEADPEDVDLMLVFADVYQNNRGRNGQAFASKYYRKIIDLNPMVAPARVGLARVALVSYQQSSAKESCEKALQIDPSLVSAMNVLAAIHVGDGDYEKADALWDRAKKVNPKDKEARAVHAARVFISGDKAGFEAIEKAVLADDPTCGSFYTIVAELVGERQRRFDIAAELSAKAIATDPTDDQAYVVQAVNLMNLGREQEAKKAFDAAYKAAKGWGDVVRENFIQALEILDTFVETKTEHFIIRQHPSEARAMAPYLAPLLEQSWRDLSKKYGFEVEGPILVESFHRHDDFSARSVGAIGLPAIGVCFGKVITLDGPGAQSAMGPFSWAKTAWHEFAHVVTLQMSKGQVPRWLTEGLSVHEEKEHRALWGREMDQELYSRWKNGRLLKMAEINHAFHGRDVMFAYFQGGLIADYVKKEWGFEAITKMLRRFGDDVPTEKVFTEILKIPLADFDKRLSDYVGTLVGGYKLVPRWDDESKKEFTERTAKDPADAEAWTRLAWAYFQRGNAIDAGAALEKARALAPESPEVVLLEAQMALKTNRRDIAQEKFAKYLSLGADDMHARLALAKLALEDKKSADAVRHYEAAKACFPRYVGGGNAYVELHKLYLGESKTDKAMAELEALAEIAQEDYPLRKKLLAWYASKKNDAGILRICQEMIEITPFGAPHGKPPELEPHKQWAEALTRAGKKEEAAREWRVQVFLIDTFPEEERKKVGGVEARLKLGDLLLDLNQPEEALEAALGAIALDADSLPAKTLKARAEAAGGAR